MRVVASSAVAATLLALMSGLAAADPADDAFKKGRELFKAGQYAEACVQFEQSQALDPQLGTLFNLGQCHEKIGKLASALAAYREVMNKDANPERRNFAAELTKQLTPRVPKLVVQIDGKPLGLVVRIGERRVTANRPIEMDYGRYVLQVQAFGMQNVRADVRISENDEGRTLTVIVPLAAEGSAQAALPTQRSSPTEEEMPRSTRKLLAIGAVGLGAATLVVGGVFGWHAMSTWKDAEGLCDGVMCATETEAARANDLRDTALRSASISNILFIAGGAIAVTGIVLWATAPSAEQNMVVSAVPGPDGATVTLAGHF